MVSLWLLRRYLSGFSKVVCVGVLGLSAIRARYTIAEFKVSRERVHQQMGASARCSGDGTLVESPILRQGKFVLTVVTSRFECDTAFKQPPKLRIVGGPDGLARGDEITFVGQLGPVAPVQNIELSDPIPRASAKGVLVSGGALSVERFKEGRSIFSWIDRARAHVRRRILASYVPRAEALGRALVLGENDLDPDEQLAFQKSGLSHLLAVSGTHLVFAVASLVSGLRALLLRIEWLALRVDVRRIVAPIGAVLALTYADFAGGSGSAVRAALMLTAVYVATTVGRALLGLSALAFSILFGVIVDPVVGYDISFLLSAAATAGLIVIGPGLARPLERITMQPLKWVLQALATTVSAMVFCIPLLLVLSSEITIAGILANVVAGPVGEIFALPLCLLHTIAAPIQVFERGLGLAGSGALLSVSLIAKMSASLTFAQVSLPPPTTEQFACLGIVVLAFTTNPIDESMGKGSNFKIFFGRYALLLVGALALFALEFAAMRAGAPIGKLRITAIDVGQGDSLLVDLPDGRLMLIDGGGAVTGGPDPGRFILAPLLRARRRKKIDIAVLTHPHPDHFGGLTTLLPNIPVGEFWEAGDIAREQAGELANLRQILHRKKTKFYQLKELCGSTRHFASAKVEVLGPCPNANPAYSANDQSLVLRLSIGRRTAILPGDAEVIEERDLIDQQGRRLRADLLKLGHHGSKSSTSENWLYAVQPAMAIASVGLRNRFGHPHSSTLERLRRHHVPIYRTDELGSIQWTTNGDTVDVQMATCKVVTNDE
jgi:competence protein ComEC